MNNIWYHSYKSGNKIEPPRCKDCGEYPEHICHTDPDLQRLYVGKRFYRQWIKYNLHKPTYHMLVYEISETISRGYFFKHISYMVKFLQGADFLPREFPDQQLVVKKGRYYINNQEVFVTSDEAAEAFWNNLFDRWTKELKEVNETVDKMIADLDKHEKERQDAINKASELHSVEIALAKIHLKRYRDAIEKDQKTWADIYKSYHEQMRG